MTDKPQNFMTSLPGILTGIAAIITAATGLYLAIQKSSIQSPVTPPPPPINSISDKHIDTDDPIPKDKPNTPTVPKLPTDQVTKSSTEDLPLTRDKKFPNEKTLEPIPEKFTQEELLTATPDKITIKQGMKAPFPETGPLVDCTLFPTVNTVASLMSWSNYYQKEVIAANGLKRQATEPCNQTIDYRGMAHCKEPNNSEVRQALLDTLTLCRAADIEWTDIRHSTILGNNK